MKKIISLIVIIILCYPSTVAAQDQTDKIEARKNKIEEKNIERNGRYKLSTFDKKVKEIEKRIENIALEEKNALKLEIESLNNQLEKGQINEEKATEQKLKLSETSATNIERRIAAANQDLKNLIQEKVDGKLKQDDSITGYYFSFPSMKLKYKTLDSNSDQDRTTTQFVIAVGFNNLITNDQVAHSDYR